jgi:hypothetical protein
MDSASSPTYLHLMGGGGRTGEPGKCSPDIPGPPVHEDLGAGAASPKVTLLGTPTPVSCTTKSCNELLALSLSLGPVPTTSWLAVPCNALPILGTSVTDAIIGRLEDVTGHAADR